MSRSNSVDAAAFRASAEYFLLNDLAIRLSPDKENFYLALFQEHFSYLRNAETLIQIRNSHNKFIDDIQKDLRQVVKSRTDIKLVYDKDDTTPKIDIIKKQNDVNFKLG
jgi:hypothetical protein